MAKFITKMTKADALAPIVALEACVVAGRTYQAYKRGKWDEARERFIEETMGSITWLLGVKSLNALGDKIVARILKSNGKNFDVGTDKVLRTPFNNFMKNEKPKFTPNQVALIKSAKVMTSIVLANAFIGFVVPKVNQALTRKLRHDRKQELNNKEQNQNLSFKGGAMNAVNAFTHIIENTNTGQLLSSDAGIAGGRMYNARSKEERREIAIRDIGSIYFYMWARGHVGNLMNYVESGRATRLNSETAGTLNSYIREVLDKNGGSMSVEEFRKAILGDKSIKVPEGIRFEQQELSSFSKLMKKKPIEVIKLSEAEKLFKDTETIDRLRRMSQLQPLREGEAILTKQQVLDAMNKSAINNPEFLDKVFTEFSGGVHKEEYRFITNSKLYKLKSQMEDYISDVCKSAKGGKVDKSILDMAKKKNIRYNGINFATGFALSAAVISTYIPKLQYYITKKSTGVDAFPGTYDFEHHKEIDA